jgi:hypothetical protein
MWPPSRTWRSCLWGRYVSNEHTLLWRRRSLMLQLLL